MPRPSVLSRRNPHLNKKDFGHVLVVAGSASMLGACALTSLSAMRAGAGLVTAAVPAHLNLTLQKKISPVIMTLPLPKNAFRTIKKAWGRFNAIAIGPGLGLTKNNIQLVKQIVEQYPGPVVVDADALNILAACPQILLKAQGVRLLTPHEGEMARLIKKAGSYVARHRKEVALDFARKHNCILVLKGPQTLIATPQGKITVNKTGNVGMATAGSGDVLTGMIAAYLAQGISPYEAAVWGVYDHGKAGDLAAKARSKSSLIATDIINAIK